MIMIGQPKKFSYRNLRKLSLPMWRLIKLTSVDRTLFPYKVSERGAISTSMHSITAWIGVTEPPKTLRGLCVFTKFPQQDSGWNFCILHSEWNWNLNQWQLQIKNGWRNDLSPTICVTFKTRDCFQRILRAKRDDFIYLVIYFIHPHYSLYIY